MNLGMNFGMNLGMNVAMKLAINRRTAAIGALALLCLLQLLAVLRAGPAHHPGLVTVTLAPGQSIALGRRELAAPQADLRQVGLRRAADGSWWLRNLQPARALVLGADGVFQRSGRTLLRSGQQLQIGPARFDVVQATPDMLRLRGAGADWRYDGARLLRNDVQQAACPDSGAAARVQAAWNRLAPRLLASARPLAFGGNLHCGNRIGIAHTEPGSATVRDMALASSPTSRTPILVDVADPALAELALAGVDTLAIGRSRFALQAAGASLALRPQRDVALFEDARTALPPQVDWQWTRRALWQLPGPVLPAALLLACAAVLAARRHPGAIPAAIAVAGVTALLMGRAGAAPGPGISMLLGWATLWSFLLAPRRLGLAGAAGVLLLAIGLLLQLELGLGAASSIWVRHFHKTCALLAIGLGVGGALRCANHALPQRRLVELWLVALAVAALGALGLQVLFGDETGVFDLQPVEFAKLVLAALAAHCVAVGLGWHGSLPQYQGALLRWVRLGAPALLLAALFGLALVQVNDYSPLLLLVLWCAAMALAWALAARKPALAAAVVGVAIVTGSGIALLRGADAGQLAQWGFYPDRFEVWLDPAGHPHTGAQVLLAGRAIAAGQWWGLDGMLGLSTLGGQVGDVLGIPAVQDDFAPSFLIHRHGLAGALALWLLQAAFLAGLVRTAAGAHRRAAQARDFRLVWLGRFQCFALCGGAAFVFGHLLLSWGTNLAILPIMGQPMSFLSAGGSHLLFFICPLLTFDAISGAATEPNQPFRRADHAGLRPT